MNSTQNMNNKLNQKLQGQMTPRTEPSKSLERRSDVYALSLRPFMQERPSLGATSSYFKRCFIKYFSTHNKTDEK